MKTFEVEIWTEDCKEPLIYQIGEDSFSDAYRRAQMSVKVLRMHGMKCRLIKIQEV